MALAGRAVLADEARRDVLGVYLRIALRSEPAGDRFLVAFERTCTRLSGRPGLGAPVASEALAAAGCRVARVERFRNHLVFYRPIAGGIEVLRVLRGASGRAAELLGGEPC